MYASSVDKSSANAGNLCFCIDDSLSLASAACVAVVVVVVVVFYVWVVLEGVFCLSLYKFQNYILKIIIYFVIIVGRCCRRRRCRHSY